MLFFISDETEAKLDYHYTVKNILKFFQAEYNLDHLSFVSYDQDDKNVNKMIQQFISSEILSQDVISFCVHHPASIGNSSTFYDTYLPKNVLAVASASKPQNWENYLEFMTKLQVKSSVLLFVGDMDSQQWQLFMDMSNNLFKNALFYVVFQDTSPKAMVWYRVITVKSYKTSVINPLQIDSGGRLTENYDMQGLHIISITLSWAPYFTLLDCNEDKQNCQSEGYLTDVMNILGEMMNFTWESHGEIEGNWGTTSISGPSNSSGVWGGVVGNVFNGSYPLSIRYFICGNFLTCNISLCLIVLNSGLSIVLLL
jgi:hypothetical protein